MQLAGIACHFTGHSTRRSPDKREPARAVLNVVPEYVTGIMEHGLLYL